MCRDAAHGLYDFDARVFGVNLGTEAAFDVRVGYLDGGLHLDGPSAYQRAVDNGDVVIRVEAYHLLFGKGDAILERPEAAREVDVIHRARQAVDVDAEFVYRA